MLLGYHVIFELLKQSIIHLQLALNRKHLAIKVLLLFIRLKEESNEFSIFQAHGAERARQVLLKPKVEGQLVFEDSVPLDPRGVYTLELEHDDRVVLDFLDLDDSQVSTHVGVRPLVNGTEAFGSEVDLDIMVGACERVMLISSSEPVFFLLLLFLLHSSEAHEA